MDTTPKDVATTTTLGERKGKLLVGIRRLKIYIARRLRRVSIARGDLEKEMWASRSFLRLYDVVARGHFAIWDLHPYSDEVQQLASSGLRILPKVGPLPSEELLKYLGQIEKLLGR